MNGALRKASLSLIVMSLILGSLSVPVPFRRTLAAPEELFLTILHTNDEHSALLPSPLSDYNPDLTAESPAVGGFARLATVVRQIRAAKTAAAEPVLLVSAGDFLTGSPFSWLALQGQAAELELLHELAYDVVILGNHEWDYGPDLLADYLRAAGYPEASAHTAVLATNTQLPAGHDLHNVGIERTRIMTLANGLQVGFLGLIGYDAIEKSPYAKPVTFADPIEAARTAVAELQAAQVDVIVAVTHAGIQEDRELAQAVPGIHVIVGGHCHTALEQPVIEGSTIIVQAGSSISHLGVLELAFSPATGEVRMRNQETGTKSLVHLDSTIASDSHFASRVNNFTSALNETIARLTQGRFNDVNDTVVYSGFTLPDRPAKSETPFGNFVADAMRLVAEEVTNEKVHVAIQANGVIRGSLVPGGLPDSEGRVALLDLLDLIGMGFGPDGEPGYPMVSIYFTGEEVRRILEISVLLSELMGNAFYLQVSGLRADYDPSRAILGYVPIKNIPIPTGRAVLSAELYTGEGPQDEATYRPLKRKDEELYHVVSDYYLAAFLPLVGEMLPHLGIVMKDRNGNPISAEEGIVYRQGEELKVWQAVLEYAAAQPLDAEGRPRIADIYASTQCRLVQKKGLPLLLIPGLILVMVVGLIVFLVSRRRRRRLGAQVL